MFGGRRRLSAGLVLAGLAVGLLPIAAPARAADAGVSIDGTGALAVGSPGTGKATILDELGTARTVAVTLDGPFDPKVTVQPASVTLPANGHVEVTVTAPAGLTTVESGWLVVTDAGHGVVRRALTVGPLADAAVAGTSVTRLAWILPWQTSATLEPLPVTAGSVCPASGTSGVIRGVLQHDEDTAKVKAWCAGTGAVRRLDLQVTQLPGWTAGDYTGKLTIGAQTVDVTVRRSTNLWVAIACLLVGILLALVLRAIARWRPVGSVLADVEQLQPETGVSAAWDGRVAAAVQKTQVEIREHLAAPAGAKGSRRWLRLLLLPSSDAVVTAATADLDTARAVLADWRDNAKDLFDTLPQTPPALPLALSARARVLVRADDDAMREPPVPGQAPAPRDGVPGLSAVLAEVRALQRVAALLPHLDTMETCIEQSPAGKDGDEDLRKAERELKARALLLVRGMTAHIEAADDATALDLDADLATLAAVVEQLPPPAAAQLLEVQDAGDEEADAALTFPDLRRWLGSSLGAVRLLVLDTRFAIRLADAVAVGVTALVVVSAGLSALYLGQAWGTVWDLLAALLAATGGALALTPLVEALQRAVGVSPVGDA